MARASTALVALLAVLALGAAAGGFETGGGPDLESDRVETDVTATSTPEGVPPPLPFRNETAPGTPNASRGSEHVESAPPATVAESGSGGISPLFVAGFVGALLTCLALAVALTGDDDRAPPPTPSGGSDEGPLPPLAVRYGRPADSAVVRAWERLAGAADSDPTETPAETARRAADAGLPRDPVQRLAGSFRAVRYGGRPPDEPERERDARDALAALERADDDR